MNRSDLIKSYIPEYLRNAEPLKSIYEAQGYESGALFNSIEDVLNQYFVDTATWGLDRWESFLQIPTDPNKDITFRRDRIKAKMFKAGTVTKQYLKDLSLTFQNGEIEVIEDFANYSITIKFTGLKGVPPNLEDYVEAVNDVIPAHVAWSYQFTYMTWDEFDAYNKTWDAWDALNLTWDDLETYQE